jgi:hypothetical protein
LSVPHKSIVVGDGGGEPTYGYGVPTMTPHAH